MTPENKFKIKYVIMVLLVVLFTTIAIGGAIYISVVKEITSVLPDFSDVSLTKDVIFKPVNSLLLVIIPVLFVVVSIVSVFILSGIAAPIFRLNNEIKAIGRGDFTVESTGWKGEELSELFKTLNDAKKNLSSMVFEQRSQINKVLEIADSLLKEIEKNKTDKTKVEKLTDSLNEGLDKVQINLSKFRINK